MPLLRTQHSVLPGFTLSFALSVLFICLVILVPLSGLAIHVSQMSWAQYWGVITDPRSLASFRVTLLAAAGASGINAVVGLLLAWVITRYRFPGRRLMDALVDLPFALPTAVAGLTLSALFLSLIHI